MVGIVLLFLTATGWTRLGEDYLEQSATRALEAFAVSRAINAVISVLQEIEPGFSVGVSVSAKPGQVLDPINDLVERFSNAMLFVSAILFSLRLLSEVATTPMLVGGVGALAVLGWWFSVHPNRLVRKAAGWNLRTSKAAFALVAYLLLIPLASEALHRTDTVSSQYNGAVSELRSARSSLEGVASLDRTALQRQLEDFRAEAERMATDLSRQVVVQISVFVLETVLLPLAGLWLVVRLWVLPALRGEVDGSADW